MHESAGSLFHALLEVQNLFQKQFSHKVLYNYCEKSKECFGEQLKNFKTNFSLYFQQKNDLAGGRGGVRILFVYNIFSKKAEHL